MLSERRMKGFPLLPTLLRRADGDGLPMTKGSGAQGLIGLGPDIGWGGSAYLNVPMKQRPSPLNPIFGDLTGGRRLNPALDLLPGGIDFDTL